MRLFLFIFLFMFGCATGGNIQPLDPLEAQILTQASVAVLLESKKDLNVEELQQVNTLFEESRKLLMLTLSENPTEIPTVGQTFVKGISPAYQSLISAVVGVVIVRVSPAIDKGQTELAAKYINAVLTGAEQAVQDRIAFEQGHSQVEYSALESFQSLERNSHSIDSGSGK